MIYRKRIQVLVNQLAALILVIALSSLVLEGGHLTHSLIFVGIDVFIIYRKVNVMLLRKQLARSSCDKNQASLRVNTNV